MACWSRGTSPWLWQHMRGAFFQIDSDWSTCSLFKLYSGKMSEVWTVWGIREFLTFCWRFLEVVQVGRWPAEWCVGPRGCHHTFHSSRPGARAVARQWGWVKLLILFIQSFGMCAASALICFTEFHHVSPLFTILLQPFVGFSFRFLVLSRCTCQMPWESLSQIRPTNHLQLLSLDMSLWKLCVLKIFEGNSSDLGWFRWTCWKSTWIPFRMMHSWWLCYLPACVPRRAPDTTGTICQSTGGGANLAHPAPAFCTGRASTRCSTRRSAHGFHHPRSTGETMHQSQISKYVETWDSLRHISQTDFQYLSVLAS